MQNKFSKILIAIVLVLVVSASLCALSACNKESVEVDKTVVAFTVSAADAEGGGTLSDYMNALKSAGKLSFDASSGYVTAINGLEQSTLENKYWFLYTDDAEYGNSAWGTYDYNGATLNSSTVGIEQPLKAGCTYVWVYQTVTY